MAVSQAPGARFTRRARAIDSCGDWPAFALSQDATGAAILSDPWAASAARSRIALNSAAVGGSVPSSSAKPAIHSWALIVLLSLGSGSTAEATLGAGRHGSGGSSGLQSRQGVEAPRLEGSIPSPLRILDSDGVRRCARSRSYPRWV